MIEPGRYTVGLATRPEEIAEAQALRHRCFPPPAGTDMRDNGREIDPFDDRCDHVLLREHGTGRLVGSFRLLLLEDGAEISKSYSAQFYDLSRLEAFAGPVAELSRFCIDPEVKDPDVLRRAWAALTQIVDERSVGLLFGCTSFAGNSPAPYRSAFGLLAQKSLAPAQWRPRRRAQETVDLAQRAGETDPKQGFSQLPPLLRSYLAMGGWVSDHAVIDRKLGTIHVFTGLDIARIPPVRKRLLRAMALPGLAVLNGAQ
jgi:putative hemolysin